MKPILVENLCKDFNGFSLTNVNLHVNKGEFLALIGLNGAGKTTLLSLIGGLLRPSKGKIFIMGRDVRNLKAISEFIGFVHQYTGLPELLKTKEFLLLEARMRNLDREVVEEALDLTGLSPYWNTKICDLSEGSKRKLVVLKALLHYPKVLLLDEPTVGLDPIVRDDIWEYLLKLKLTGLTAIISTNYLNEAEYLCDRVALVMNGTIVAESSINEIKNLNPDQHVIFVTFKDKEKDNLEDIAEYLWEKERNLFHSINIGEKGLKIITKIESSLALPSVVKFLSQKKIRIMSISCMENSLEAMMRYFHKKGGKK